MPYGVDSIIQTLLALPWGHSPINPPQGQKKNLMCELKTW